MYRAVITIYSEFDPSQVELTDLAHEASAGEAYCDSMKVETVERETLSEGALSFFHDGEVIGDMIDLGEIVKTAPAEYNGDLA